MAGHRCYVGSRLQVDRIQTQNGRNDLDRGFLRIPKKKNVLDRLILLLPDTRWPVQSELSYPLGYNSHMTVFFPHLGMPTRK